MPTLRAIDRDERTRKRPMRILVLGMCRTGTTSLSAALRKLGYTPHQMRDVLLRPKDLSLWQEAIDLTFSLQEDSKQAPYARPEFDKLLSEYDVVMDLPGCVFARELIAAYPDAKVILTSRKYADWEKSMQDSIWCLDTWSLFILCRKLNITQLAPLMRLVHSVFRVHSNNTYGGVAARRSFDRHYETVRELVPRERLLEINMDGDVQWAPLCKFLGDEAPEEPFPRLNEEKAMRANLERAWWGMVRYLVSMIVLPGLITVGAFLLYTYVDDMRSFRDERILAPIKAFMDG
ncbi:hypothetical protein ACN47E_003535 [Coniothyrium glycines]